MITALLALSLCTPLPQQPTEERLPLAVLYAGNADTPYSVAWEKFLGAHAARVKVIAGSKLSKADLDGFDLLVIDGEVESHDDKGDLRLKDEKVRVALDELQGFPVVLMGGQGGFVSDDLHLKTSWHSG